MILLLIASIIAILVKYIRLPYTIALVLCGLGVGLFKLTGIHLTQEMIFFFFLPPLLFEGAIHFDATNLKENIRIIGLLSFIGIILSSFVAGYLVFKWIGLPFLFALLLGAMIMPTDPISVLALFKKLGVSRRLSIIVEGESVFNDGTGVVLFSVILGIITASTFNITDTILNFIKIVAGGLAVGVILGYIVYKVLKSIDDHVIEVLLTIILAYASFIIAENLHLSGVMAVVAAGILIGNRGVKFAMSPTTRISINNFWEILAFIVNSLIFLLIGIEMPVTKLITHLPIIGMAIVIVVLARAVTVYPLIGILNLFKEKVSLRWQHIINWGGIHGSIPIALVLGLPDIKYKEEISAMVFGVVLFSLIVQGVSMKWLIRKLKIVDFSELEREYEKNLAKKKAIKWALRTLKDLHEDGEITNKMYTALKKEYDNKFKDIKKKVLNNEKVDEVIELKRLKVAERKLLMEEKNSIRDSMIKGVISDESAHELLSDINIKLEELD